jgi:nicotinamide-nucleotide amidase
MQIFSRMPIIAVQIKILAELLNANRQKLVTAESCTGGQLAAAFTKMSGCSSWFERGFVTYSNEAKVECLNVSKKTLETYGAVSKETAMAMAEGALKNSHATVAISVTGIAGPSGGSKEKPVGTVWFGFAVKGKKIMASKKKFSGTRNQIQKQAVAFAINQLLNIKFKSK